MWAVRLIQAGEGKELLRKTLDALMAVNRQRCISWLHDVVLRCPPNYDFELSEFGLTIARWTKLIHQYMAPDIEDFFRMAPTIHYQKKEISFVPPRKTVTQLVGSHTAGGGCLSGIFFRRGQEPRLLLVSRTSSFDKLAPLDLAIAVKVARGLSDALGDEVWVNWYIRTVRLGFVNFPAICQYLGVLDEMLEADYPICHYLRRTWRRWVVGNEYPKMGILRTAIKKYARMIQDGDLFLRMSRREKLPRDFYSPKKYTLDELPLYDKEAVK